MPSRQDELHSYQFMMQRLVAAIVMRETDPVRPPFRRVAGATLAGVLVALIALGGFVVYGVVTGDSGGRWRDPAAVVVERESGARYVYRDGRLHLVVNYASALLIVGAERPETVLVTRRAIEGTPRGETLGIVDAPDALPAASRLLGAPWTVCSAADGTAGGSAAGGGSPRSALLVGSGPRPGEPVGEPLGDRGLLARHPDGSLHLVWQNRRHAVRDTNLVLTALGWSTRRPVTVAPAFLNALTAGPDLARVRIPGEGTRSARVPGARVGEVFVVSSQGGDRQYAVALRDGLAGITQVQADLLLTANRQGEPTALAQGAFAAIAKRPDLVPAGAAPPPATTPDLTAGASGGVCATVTGENGATEVRVGAGEVASDPRPVAGEGGAVGPAVDHVVVPPGRGAVVEAVAAPAATGGAVFVVTDLGRRHPVPSAEVLPMLGSGDTAVLRLPAALVALVPAGVALDPEAARAPAR